MREKQNLSDVTILICSSDKINIFLKKHTVKNLLLPTEEIYNVSGAIHKLNEMKDQTVIILLDLDMPSEEAFILLQHFKNHPLQYNYVKPIVVTLRPYDEFEKSGLAPYIFQYMEKPIEDARLMNKILVAQYAVN